MPGYAKPPPVNASSIAYSPTGNVAATNIQNAITELDLEKSYGFRNVLINGGFAIDQRNSGATQTITAGAANAYTVDRWAASCTGANITGARIAGAIPDQYYYQFTGATSNTQVSLTQRTEAANSFHLAGRTVTLSVKIASTSLTSINWFVGYAASVDNFGAGINTASSGTFTISPTLTTYTATFTLPSAATTGIRVLFQSTGLAATQTLTFASAQLELGSIATPFENRPYGTELALCQRYYWRTSSYADGLIGSAFARTATNAYATVKYPVTMRAVPVIDSNSGTNYFAMGLGASDFFATSISLVNPQIDGSLVLLATTGMTIGTAGWLRTASAAAYLGFNAEL